MTDRCRFNDSAINSMTLLLALFIAGLSMAQTATTPPAIEQARDQSEETPSVAIGSNALQDWNRAQFWQTQDGRLASLSWEFAEDEIRLVHPRGGQGSLLSPPMPAHFELAFKFKIGPDANTGIKYRVRQFGNQWLGVEYQIIDEPIPLAEPSRGSTASIYELQAPRIDKPLRPVGEWNEARIVACGSSIEHYLNGQRVTQASIEGPIWESQIAHSKFFGRAAFGQPATGDRIMITDHGGQAVFKDFRLVALQPPPMPQQGVTAPQLGNGLRNGWADQTSIVLWTRTTARAEMIEGPQFKSLPDSQIRENNKSTDVDALNASQLADGYELDEMLGACPGAAGEVRLTYFPQLKRHAAHSTPWTTTRAESDFAAQWKLEQLTPNTEYAAIIEARPTGIQNITAVRRGSFRTAPADDQSVAVRFCMTTCHDFTRCDDGLNGHKIYPSMTAIDPHFVVHAGDIEYYDKPHPWAWTVELMRFKWGRIFALPRNREFYSNYTTYFIKDDHDTLKNDCWAGQTYGAVTFEEGVRLFNEEQFPSRSPRYASVAWGPHVQIWVLEGRDYRSPNSMPDGPDKTILGTEQKQWLLQTLSESRAAFKLVFSPTPIVGPDRDNKKDNHANDVFEFEGQQLREAFSGIENLIVFCGDRHWQYASQDETTGLWEFGCGPGSATHELGWKEGDVRPEHKFLRVQGGFLSGQVSLSSGEPRLTLRHHTVSGEQVSQFVFP